ncbi:MAG TPA: carbohydrate kinase family protein [Streptosporangiaceae bacterium]|nr:carbohydrate kinase family protein [Streptosporangiaceae bacterium]
MRQIVTGSIATDHLMVFPGRFTEQLVQGKLDKVSLSFLVDELEIHRGGIAANVAFGLARLGLRPILVGSVGADFAGYRAWLEAHDVDTRHVRVSGSLHTARFLCTTDADNNQIASFYAGAMNEARHIDLAAILRSERDADVVLICPDDPDAMLRHTQACRDCAVPFAADPSQQIARMDGTDLRRLVDGARYLFTNEYERALLIRKTGWDTGQLLRRVGAWVTTTGPDGAVVESATQPAVSVPAAALRQAVDPTGAGDAFRAGFLAGIAHGLGHQGAARLGCTMAALVMETSGTQEYQFQPEEFLARISGSYGSGAAAEMAARIGLTLPA